MCTRIFWSGNPVAKVVARTMDWAFSDEPRLWVLPRGLLRTGGAGPGSAEWRSENGSVVLSAWGGGVSDGVNEAGLAAHVLYLGSSRYEQPDERPPVGQIRWVQYVLDTATTVSEALERMADVRIASLAIRDMELGAHLALEDTSGDSAIVEYLDGEQVVHHGREYEVMANDPGFDEQLANLTRYRPFGGDLAPPGDITSLHRFVRAAYFLHYLPTPTDAIEATAGVLQIARNVAVPYGAPYDDFSTYPTWWISVADLTNRVYYFGSTLSPNVVWLELDSVSFAPDEPVRALDPRSPTLVGNVSDALEPATLEA